MPKISKKSTKKKATATLVWKRSKPGRPKSPKSEAKTKKTVKKPTKSVKKPAKKVKIVKKIAKTTKKTIKLVKKPIKKKVLPPVSIQHVTEDEILVVQAQEKIKETNGGELRVEAAKFDIGPKQNGGEFHAHNLPFEYGHNRIILLVVDPTFVFTYWEIQTEKMHEALNRIGNNAKLTLRFYNLSAGPNSFWDVSIYERVGNWYLKLMHPNQKLRVEVGMKNDRGEFYTLATSNTMHLPRQGLAGRGPIKWMLVSASGEMVITEVEEYTDADLELLKRILGPYFYDLMKRGRFGGIVGSSLENIFQEIAEIMPPSLSS